MKCPHCGMNIRDNTVICGYCGGKLPQRPEKSPESGKRANPSGEGAGRQSAGISKPPEDEQENEEEGGLSVLLQPGEKVLIGSLNISVKKFFFHAYLTDRRIFLIDTQEKKLKVTAKDIPRETITGSIVEFSESSDPVVVLSIRSSDDEVKTMKLVFVQNGMDRSAETDEWIALLNQEKPERGSPERETEEPEETKEVPEPEPARPEKPLHKHTPPPARKPVKDHEKQPPVKRPHALYSIPEEEKHEPAVSSRHEPVRQAPEPVRKTAKITEIDYELPAAPEADRGAPGKPSESPSAMKVAMKGAMKPLRRPVPQPVKRPAVEPPLHGEDTGTGAEKTQVRRLPVREKPEEEEGGEIPQFCHNCGKKLPPAANFCPGCGTRLGQGRTLPDARFPQASPEKKAASHDTLTYKKKTHARSHEEEHDEAETEDEKPQATKPPVKKAPKGSEMTILHKFLRR